MNRIVITTILGFVAGILCALGLWSMNITMTTVLVAWILLNRTVLGFVLGISSLRLHWALHGAVIGVVVGSLFSFSTITVGRAPLLSVITLVASAVFGIAIEWLTSVVFKCPQQFATGAGKSKAAAA
ncbi:MAG: hypothetical protein ACE14L_16495 [Terriglobales bacterium]